MYTTHPHAVLSITAALILTTAACSQEPGLVEPPLEPPSALLTRGQAFNRVTVNPRAPANSAGAVAATLVEALDRVSPGGTIRLLPGTHATHRVLINKPVTIEGVGLPTLDAEGMHYNLAVDFETGAAPAGPVVIRGLRLVNGLWANVWISNRYETVLIEDAEFHPHETGDVELFEDRFYSSGVAVYASGNGVTVRNSRFLEGAIGVIGDRNVRVESSYFRGQSNAAIHGGDVDAIGNTVEGCDYYGWCFFLGDFHDPVHLEVRENRIETGRPVHNPIVIIGGGGTAVITGNTIIGTDAAGNPLQPRDPKQMLDGSGIDLSLLASVEVSGNSIRNLYRGVTFGDGVLNANGRDNTVDSVVEGFMSFPGVNVTFRFNDISRYLAQPASVAMDGAVDITCNWWGSAEGPSNAIDLNPYRPWATEPIAGKEATSCTGAP
jgi:hypothetical protein